MRKIRMPKTRAEFEFQLMNAFMVGCNHGYGIVHEVDVFEQEKLGAENWIGKISDEELCAGLNEIRSREYGKD